MFKKVDKNYKNEFVSLNYWNLIYDGDKISAILGQQFITFEHDKNIYKWNFNL